MAKEYGDKEFNRDFKKLARDMLFQALGDLASAGIRAVRENDERKRIDLLSVQKEIQLDQFARLIAFQFILQGGIPA